SGQARAEWNGRILVLKRGQIYLFPAGIAYELSADRLFEHFFLHFTMEIAPGMDLFRGKKNPESLPAPPDLKKVKWKNLFFGDQLSGWMKCASHLQSLISAFVDLSGDSLAEAVRLSGKYAALFEAVRRQPFAKQRVSSLASAVHMSPRILRHAFQKDMGMSIPEFVRRRFIARAQDLLLDNSMKIREISAELGFRDEYHFSRLFHRVTGLSPRRYRSLHQEKNVL
ncbi:MAG: helix-turn-helix transcriptional regulator, partial [Spirochaetia bacterium]|nr:helix-turn-helix transcriptional regulator [Spirochaetia bacterium]